MFYDRTSLIEACIDTVIDALLEGGLLVVLVLFLFVAELRTALIVVFSLPLTFLITFIVMGQVGLTANLMSLGGLAFSVGMVVDASIVVVENMRRHLAHAKPGEAARDVVARAVIEVARPVAFSVLIIAIMLVPLFTLQGIEGKMFAPLALTMLIALLVSLVVALTVVPALSDLLLRVAPEREFGFVRRFHQGYLRLLQVALRRRGRTMLTAGVVLAGSLALLPLLGTEFMPPLDEGSIAINVVRLPNASLEGSVEVAAFLEKRLLRVPGGGDGGQQDRPRRDLRGPDGPRADRRLHHAQAARSVQPRAQQGGAGRRDRRRSGPDARTAAIRSPSRSRCGSTS